MPVMDGITTSHELRKLMGNSSLPKIPLICLSALNEGEIKQEKCKTFDEILMKPLLDSQLKTILSKYCKYP
jgi:CheY-like chemotaxis protein